MRALHTLRGGVFPASCNASVAITDCPCCCPTGRVRAIQPLQRRFVQPEGAGPGGHRRSRHDALPRAGVWNEGLEGEGSRMGQVMAL